ncbi:MAG: transcriptional repressor [Caulobacterales bacterium]|nr:transcriptional repressor [Caulobacterales bacterium]
MDSLNEADVQTAVRQAEALCAAKGARLTQLRRRAVAALAAAGGRPVKAYDLLPALGEGGAPAKPATAYRALEFLEALGLVHRVAGLNAFVLCTKGGGAHITSLFICEGCGRTEERSGGPLASEQGPPGFSVTRSVVEHYGRCADCAEARDAAEITDRTRA